MIEQSRRTPLEPFFRRNANCIITVPAGSKQLKAHSSAGACNLLKLAQQVLRIDVSSLAAKAAGQRP
jgi:hypothetical protein